MVEYTIAAARAARKDGRHVPSVLLALAEDGRAKVTREHEWRGTMAVALGQLPSGACLTVRDSDGRDWLVGPAVQDGAASSRKAA